MAEFSGDFVAESGCAHFRNRQSAGSHDQDRRSELQDFAVWIFGSYAILTIEDYFLHSYTQNHLSFRCGALSKQHRHNIGCGTVAEKLPFRGAGIGMFLVKRNLVFFDELDEIGRCKSSQRRTAEVGIFGQEILRATTKIREITAAAS